MERRWGNRVMLDEAVSVTRDGELIGTASLPELSLSGAFLKTEWRLPQLARVYVEVPRLRHERRSRHTLIEAFVVRHCPDGVGVEWCEFAPPEVVAVMDERRQLAPPPSQRESAYLAEYRADYRADHRPDGTGPRRRLR